MAPCGLGRVGHKFMVKNGVTTASQSSPRRQQQQRDRQNKGSNENCNKICKRFCDSNISKSCKHLIFHQQLQHNHELANGDPKEEQMKSRHSFSATSMTQRFTNAVIVTPANAAAASTTKVAATVPSAAVPIQATNQLPLANVANVKNDIEGKKTNSNTTIPYYGSISATTATAVTQESASPAATSEPVLFVVNGDEDDGNKTLDYRRPKLHVCPFFYYDHHKHNNYHQQQQSHQNNKMHNSQMHHFRNHRPHYGYHPSTQYQQQLHAYDYPHCRHYQCQYQCHSVNHETKTNTSGNVQVENNGKVEQFDPRHRGDQHFCFYESEEDEEDDASIPRLIIIDENSIDGSTTTSTLRSLQSSSPGFLDKFKKHPHHDYDDGGLRTYSASEKPSFGNTAMIISTVAIFVIVLFLILNAALDNRFFDHTRAFEKRRHGQRRGWVGAGARTGERNHSSSEKWAVDMTASSSPSSSSPSVESSSSSAVAVVSLGEGVAALLQPSLLSTAYHPASKADTNANESLAERKPNIRDNDNNNKWVEQQVLGRSQHLGIRHPDGFGGSTGY